ncbi:hypothetical protein [Flavobacterium sp.]|uniref:hypothetical protein n=1 Tax=Flavobacterium sp. TaxID=239 RepID=UPI002BBA43AD|nr:hypothetical protein [Flavobacterium sp.]HSD06724.1 hypothetical protein [Flavobacterium sp.]
MNSEFKEEQRFTQWWLWTILIVIALIPVYGIYKQIIRGEQFGTKPMSDTSLIVAAIITFTILFLFRITQLKTQIDQNKISINFFPLMNKVVNWDEVKSAQVLKYGFVGYGIRFFTPYGIVYNIAGSIGLALELKNGKKLLIGTQKGEELTKFLETYFVS